TGAGGSQQRRAGRQAGGPHAARAAREHGEEPEPEDEGDRAARPSGLHGRVVHHRLEIDPAGKTHEERSPSRTIGRRPAPRRGVGRTPRHELDQDRTWTTSPEWTFTRAPAVRTTSPPRPSNASAVPSTAF